MVVVIAGWLFQVVVFQIHGDRILCNQQAFEPLNVECPILAGEGYQYKERRALSIIAFPGMEEKSNCNMLLSVTDWLPFVQAEAKKSPGYPNVELESGNKEMHFPHWEGYNISFALGHSPFGLIR